MMKNFFKKAKHVISNPLVLTPLFFVPLLYSCDQGPKDITNKEVVAIVDSMISKQTATLDEKFPDFSKNDPGYVVASPVLPKASNDSVIYGGRVIVNDALAEYVSSDSYFTGLILGFDKSNGYETFKKAYDEENASVQEPVISHQKQHIYHHKAKSHSAHKAVPATTKTGAVEDTLLNSLVGDYVTGKEVELNKIKPGACDTCITMDQLIFNSINEEYKQK